MYYLKIIFSCPKRIAEEMLDHFHFSNVLLSLTIQNIKYFLVTECFIYILTKSQNFIPTNIKSLTHLTYLSCDSVSEQKVQRVKKVYGSIKL